MVLNAYMPLNILCSCAPARARIRSLTQPFFLKRNALKIFVLCVWQKAKYILDMRAFGPFLWKNQNNIHIKFGVCMLCVCVVFFFLFVSFRHRRARSTNLYVSGLYFFRCQRDKFMWIDLWLNAFGEYSLPPSLSLSLSLFLSLALDFKKFICFIWQNTYCTVVQLQTTQCSQVDCTCTHCTLSRIMLFLS